MNESNNQAFEDDLQEDTEIEGEEVTDPYDIREERYRFKDGRYYFDKRPTDAQGSIDAILDYDASWEPGEHGDQYVKERDRVLREASRLQTSATGERERIRVADKKTFPHLFQDLPANFDPNPKPLYEKESPHEREGRIYLRRHKIIEMFHNMTTLMLVQKPESPKNFMINHLTSLIAVRESYPSIYDLHRDPTSSTTSTSTSEGSSSEVDAAVGEADSRLPRVFSEDNVKATFSLLEPTGKKITSLAKAKHAMRVLGFHEEKEVLGDGENEDGVINEQTFVNTANKCAIDQARTFYPRVMWEKESTPTFDAIV